MLAFAASADPDTMYYHEAMRSQIARIHQGNGEGGQESHRNQVWELVPRSSVPPGTKILPAVWAMKRKRRIATREVYKWKARLNIDGSKQEEGVNYWETFSPVASWAAIRMVLITTLIHGWYTKQIDFVLAYTQADVECQLYMAIPKGFEVQDDGQDYVLKLKKNLFGQKQAGRVWNQHLVNKLKEVEFIPSEIDECLFYKGKSVFVLYTDDSILAGPDPQELDDIIQEMKAVELNLTVEGDISDFLGVQIDRINDNTFVARLIVDLYSYTAVKAKPFPRAEGGHAIWPGASAGCPHSSQEQPTVWTGLSGHNRHCGQVLPRLG
ncbi:hypothetical protein MHU86_21065 [Fragilaria crotonensis]|nr:hypothetical protein MHU86_21065 [Fragilaria crotonensis]